MKCIVLAGGTGDALWPLSRRKYPKQFMPFRENRSLFQENIVRNMTYCDEFIIVTNKEFQYVVESQMRSLQGVCYKLILEEVSRMTALPILVATMLENQEEELMVIGSDTIVEGREYQDAMIASKNLVSGDRIVLHGIKPTKASTRFAYVIGERENVREIIYRPSEKTAEKLIREGGCYWNSGIIIYKAVNFLADFREVNPQMYAECEKIAEVMTGDIKVIPARLAVQAERTSIHEAYLEKSSKLYLLPCEYDWSDIGSLRAYKRFLQNSDTKNVLTKDSDSLVINRDSSKLVVVNGLDNAVVVNTNDAVYVTSMDKADDIRHIMEENHDRYIDYFDYNTISFRSWGKHETLKKGHDYKVKKVTVSPGQEFELHKHEYRSEQWTVVSGTPTITIGEETRDYHMGDCIYVPIGTLHKVRNNTLEDVEIVEVAVGHRVQDSDVIRVKKRITEEKNRFIKLMPAFKDYLWGGTRIRDELGKKCDGDIIAESWELSAHADGVSKVASGKYTGMYFNDYLQAIGREALGWKCQHYDRFPILIKFIDAKNPLSIQIHPDDEYALKNEGEYGKNEMWYVMDCDENSFIYYGTDGNVTREEIAKRIADNTILDVLNKVRVHKGDVFYVKAGTIHAIGGGILICEIQQSSNCTYRMYDYDRRDRFGNPRELHIKKALDVIKTETLDKGGMGVCEKDGAGNEKQLLVQCKYFECNRYEVLNELSLSIDETSFQSVMIIDGNGLISDGEETLEFKKGDSFFIPAFKNIIKITGKCELLVTHI